MIKTLAKMLSIRDDQVEDALKSERAAKRTLSRRGLLLAGASAATALVTGNTQALIVAPSVKTFTISASYQLSMLSSPIVALAYLMAGGTKNQIAANGQTWTFAGP
jgi:hypothetical protein